MRVAVASAYRFHMFDLARELERAGVLGQLLTAMPHRRVTEVDPSAVHSRPPLALVGYAAERGLHRHLAGLNRLVIADFDRFARRRLAAVDVVTGLSGFATATLDRARARGMATVCDRGSWHILEQRRVLDDESALWGWPGAWFDDWIVDRELHEYETVDIVVVPSEPARQSFIRRGHDPAKVRTVPFGVDVAEFRPAPERRVPGRILTVGSIGIQKGHPRLVGAYRSLGRSDATLVLIGPAPPDALERLRLPADDVEVMGAVPRSRVADEMQRAAVFVLASVHDGFGLVIAQAMASGVPVVATMSTGACELLDDGVEGLLIDAHDQAALAEAIASLLDDPERAAAMGEAGRRRVVAAGGWEAYGSAAVETFASVIRR